MDYNITYREKNGGIQAIVSYKDNSGRWKQKSKQGFDKKGTAKTWAQDMIDDLKDKIEYINPEYSGATFKDAYVSYTKHLELYKEPNTLTNYNAAKKYFNSLFSMEIDKITPMDIQKCIDGMVKKKRKPSTILIYTSKINTVFNYAKKHRMIKDNPVFDAVIPEDKSSKSDKIKALTKEESKDLLSKIGYYKFYLISLIALTCGLRIGEILGLSWDRINEKDSTITINRQWKVIKEETIITESGKEKKKYTYGFGTVKSKNSNRTIPIPPKTMAEIKKLKKDYPIHISGRLFPYARTDSCGGTLNALYQKIGYKVSIHDLRHTYASTLIANGLDFKTIAELMGHDVKETIDTYSHFTNDMLTKATNVINSAF